MGKVLVTLSFVEGGAVVKHPSPFVTFFEDAEIFAIVEHGGEKRRIIV